MSRAQRSITASDILTPDQYELIRADKRQEPLLRKGVQDRGVENHIAIQLGSERITARAQGDGQRTRESDGKASAVHFFHFDFTPAQIAAWQSGEGQAMLAIDHPEYGHAALFSADTRAFLAPQCFE